MHPRLGRQLDVGLFPGIRLARHEGRITVGGSELRPQPEPVLRPAAVRKPWGPLLAPSGSAARDRLRPRRQRLAGAWTVPGYAPLAGLCLHADGRWLVTASNSRC